MPLRASAEDSIKPLGARRAIRKGWRSLLGVLGLILAWHALRGVAWTGVWNLLAGIGPLAVLILLGVNLLMLPVMTARWWLLLKALGSPVSLLSTCAYRTAANAVSYLTPGPHFGGEPIAIYLLHHRQRVSLASAAASVAIDRLLELLASIVVLTFCLINLAFTQNGPFTAKQGLAIAVPAILLCVLLLFLFTGGRPLSRSIVLIKRVSGKYLPVRSLTTGSLIEIIAQSEAMAASIFCRHPYRFLLVNLFSLAQWFGVFVEFWLMSLFLGFFLSFWQLTGVIVVARLAFFTPLPAGIGILESALPWVTATFGLGSDLGLGLCLIIRFRDLLFSLVGLGLSMKYLTCQEWPSIIIDKMEKK